MYAENLHPHHCHSHQRAAATRQPLPRWQHAQQFRHGDIPAQLRPWLLAEGSLTRLLIAASNGDFRVQRMTQEWQRPTLSEARLLHIDPTQRALVREVILWGQGKPWIYARSVMPAHSLSGDLRRLRKLHNTSLGALLFRYPQLQRTPFELARIDGRTLPAALHNESRLWARRSRFTIDQRALIVGEIFLHDFVDTLTHSHRTSALRKLV